jgi:DNA polymerase-3 subunit gamma/tau
MSVSLSVKYRPKTLDEVLGQEPIVKILKRQIETNQFKNSMLFSGPSGTGKTTLARIFANEINKYTDAEGNICSSEPIEIDAASNSGVDNVRRIIEGASQRSLDGKYKVYIIDECHSISNQGWQALLKTIEEAPKYTIFIFCTTEYHKVPVTIQNRCQQYFLTRVPDQDIVGRLCEICDNEKFSYNADGIDQIVKMAQGSVRLAISFLDKCKDYSTDITLGNVLSTLGTFDYDTFFILINAIIDKDSKAIINTIETLYNNGDDLKMFLEQFISFVLDISKFTIFNSYDIIKIPKTYKEELAYVINIDGGTKYFNHILDKLMEAKQKIKYDNNIKEGLEILLLQL